MGGPAAGADDRTVLRNQSHAGILGRIDEVFQAVPGIRLHGEIRRPVDLEIELVNIAVDLEDLISEDLTADVKGVFHLRAVQRETDLRGQDAHFVQMLPGVEGFQRDHGVHRLRDGIALLVDRLDGKLRDRCRAEDIPLSDSVRGLLQRGDRHGEIAARPVAHVRHGHADDIVRVGPLSRGGFQNRPDFRIEGLREKIEKRFEVRARVLLQKRSVDPRRDLLGHTVHGGRTERGERSGLR